VLTLYARLLNYCCTAMGQQCIVSAWLVCMQQLLSDPQSQSEAMKSMGQAQCLCYSVLLSQIQ
jgi:hypothetical protein